MHYLANLYTTYNALSGEIGKASENADVLLPIYHTSVKAQIEITIDMSGNFVSAEVIQKDDRLTVIPVTNASENRTSGPVAHPLFDKLIYVAGDYCEYVPDSSATPYELYVNELSDWCSSEHKNELVCAVREYILQKKVVEDLINCGVLYIGEDGSLLEKWSEDGEKPMIFQTGIAQSDSFIRFCVERQGVSMCKLYLDEKVRNDYIAYCLSQEANFDTCYVTGSESRIARLCPGKIRNAGDKGKIISTNDESGFSYRGRLTEGSQVYAVSEEVVQKGFSALRYLIAKQGYRSGSMAILTWAINGSVEPPNPLSDLPDMLDSFSSLFNVPSEIPTTREEFAHVFNKYVSGYHGLLSNTDGIAVIILNSAILGKGRMSVTYYRELTDSEFLNRIRKWHEDTSWHQSVKRDKKEWITFVGAPAPRTIAQSVYGTKAKDEIINECIQRIMPCIIDGARLPADFVKMSVVNASRRTAFENWEWERNLSVACSLYKNYYKEEEYLMSLERERKSRDYLYGRLLAVADMLESSALRQSNEKRETNAARFMQRFADSPFETWRNLELQLAPYKSRLGAYAIRYTSEIEQIMNLFEHDDFVSNRRLSGEYLLGYYCERASFWTKKTADNEPADENNIEE